MKLKRKIRRKQRCNYCKNKESQLMKICYDCFDREVDLKIERLVEEAEAR